MSDKLATKSNLKSKMEKGLVGTLSIGAGVVTFFVASFPASIAVGATLAGGYYLGKLLGPLFKGE